MNTVQCIICQNTFLTSARSYDQVFLKLEKSQIFPWNCPNCNNDSELKIQRDLNDLFKIIGFQAIERLAYRSNRHLQLSQMYKKQDEQPTNVEFG